MSAITDDLAISLPITPHYRRLAADFAREQPTTEKAEKVLLNTLAVLVVNDCLQMLGFSTELAASDSWNPAVRMAADIADMVVIGKGRLECRPIRKGEEYCRIPLEVWAERIGYVVVEIDEDLLAGKVLGFVPEVRGERVAIAQLQPIEALLKKLHETADNPLVNLSQWWDNIFDASWQQVESLLNPQQTQIAFSFRNRKAESTQGVKRGKLIELGDNYLSLILEIQPENNGAIDIRLMLHPTGKFTTLPPSIRLTLLDEFGKKLIETQARTADNYLQLQFSGEAGERFSVKVTLGDASITEHFLI